MKKVNVLVILAFIASLGFLSSCDTTEDALGAEIEFLGGNGEDLTVTVGEAANFKFLATEGEAKLESITVEMTGGANLDHVVLFNSADNTGLDLTKSIEINKVMDEVGTYKFTITVVDKAEVETKEEILVTVTDATSGVATYTATMLAAPVDDSKTFFASSTGKVYSISEFDANINDIDFGYFWGKNGYATLASADDYITTAYGEDAEGDNKDLYPTTGLNQTLFATTSEKWEDLVSSKDLADAYAAGTLATNGSEDSKNKATRINKLTDENNQVVLFKTADKFGAILVKNIVDGSGTDGKLTIDVKVQK